MRRITGYIWLESFVEKIESKHGLVCSEVEQVFRQGPLFRRLKRGRVHGEDVYSAAGRTKGGRAVMVFFIHKADGQALVISARDMTAPEKRRYGQQPKTQT